MKYKFKIGSKVRILWDKSRYNRIPDYNELGEVKGNFTSYDGTPYVEVYNFHKRNKYRHLHFPIHAVRLLVEDVKDGDAL